MNAGIRMARAAVWARVATPFAVAALSAAALVAPAAASQRSGTDPYLAPAGNRGYDVENYDLRIRYDDQDRAIGRGLVTVTATATADLEDFSLDARRTLRIRSVRVDGNRVRFRHRDDKLIVEASAEQGEIFRTTVRYSGTPQPIRDSASEDFSNWLPTSFGVVTFNEPIGVSSWMPANDVFYDKSTWQVELITPKGLTGISTGELLDLSSKGGTTRSRWRMPEPIQPYTQLVAVDRFRVSDRPINGIPAVVAVAARTGTSVKQMRQRTASALRWLSARFGDFPFSTTGAVVVSGADGAMETAGRPVYSDAGYYHNSETVLHEMAHQWFGNLLTAHNASDMWLHEGFATYLELVEQAERKGWNLDDLVHASYVQEGWGFGDHRQFHQVTLADPTPAFVLNTTTYFRGQAALHALRAEVGEDAFWDAMAALVTGPLGETTSTEIVIRELEASTGRDLSSWAQQWVYSTGYQELPVAPTPQAVVSEIGVPLIEQASQWAQTPGKSLRRKLRSAATGHAPMDHLEIGAIRSRKGLTYVNVGVRTSPLYPQDYPTCLTLDRNSRELRRAWYDPQISFSSDFAANTFTTSACPD